MFDIYDIHTHILPKLDDGAKSLEESIKLLEFEIENKVKGVILTPHYRKNMFEASIQNRERSWQALNQEVKKRKLPIKLYMGCEFHSKRDMVELLDKGVPFTLNKTKNVLVEFSSEDNFSYVREQIFKLRSGGYKPIIAHIERYPAFKGKLNLVEELIDLGAKIQITGGAVLGDYGFFTKRTCHQLLKNHLVHFVASDLHHLSNEGIELLKCAKYISKKYGEEYAREIFETNPKEIIGEEKR
ncbi:MAG TPA: capsular biosynthesis protein [Candidatus Dorea intestinavium]|nr:capsular biosynthesis protein [Candidatus Dorea intestinavium]